MSVIFLNIYIVQIFALAFFDLISGVANDAVNFLAPAFGCKKKIERKDSDKMLIAIFGAAFLGIIFGVMSSNGMMEVARKGVFHPGAITFVEILILFGCVSLVDPFILKTFNNWKLPTSTTVSLVFGLYGAALAVKFINSGSNMTYINSDKVLSMIIWILLAVVIAFIVSSIIQYICRVILTFDYKKKSKATLILFATILNSCITYLVLFKGLKNSSLLDTLWQIENIMLYLPIFIGLFWLILFSIIAPLIDILLIVVLCGTFSIALAFAGNDLVNFVGVAMALMESISIYINSGLPNPENFYMQGLEGKVEVKSLMLFLAGLIMCFTLWLSQKSRGVLQRSIDLAHSSASDKAQGSSYISRLMVKKFIKIHSFTNQFLPVKAQEFLQKRFVSVEDVIQDKPAFDMVRASVMLAVSSIIISIATIQKLPLSTTYITFMVAMGCAFADKAWGRESAVHRVNGVLSVITGWFLTAFGASSICFIVTLIFLHIGIEALSACISAYILWNIYQLFAAKKVSKEQISIVPLLSFRQTQEESLQFIQTAIFDLTQHLPVKEKSQEADLKSLKSLLRSIHLKQNNLKNYLAKTKSDLSDKEIKYLKSTLKSFNNLEELVAISYSYSADMKLFILAQIQELQELAQDLQNLITNCLKSLTTSGAKKSKLASAIQSKIHDFEVASLRRYRKKEEKYTQDHQTYERILLKLESLALNLESFA